MAVGLEELKRKSTKNKSYKTKKSQTTLRPWEAFDQFGQKTRTIAAHEAVIKAKKITERNEKIVENLNPTEPKSKNDLSSSSIPSNWGDPGRSSGLIGFLRYLFKI